MPSPLLAFENLTTIVEKYLIINTITVKERIENKFGVLNFSEGTAVFLLGISEHKRSILREHYQTKFGWSIDDVAPRLSDHQEAVMPWREEGKLSYWPYWWLFTDGNFRSLVRLMGFKILGEYKWEDHTLQIFAVKIHPSQWSLAGREDRINEEGFRHLPNLHSNSWRTPAYFALRRLFLPYYHAALDRNIKWLLPLKDGLKRALLR